MTPPARRRPRLVGVALAIAVVALALWVATMIFLHRSNWNPDTFYLRTFEDQTGVLLVDRSEVIWKWVAPRGLDGESHYITAVIRTDGFDPSGLAADMVIVTDCFGRSGGAMRFLDESVALRCWERSNPGDPNDGLFVLSAAEEDLVLFKRRTH